MPGVDALLSMLASELVMITTTAMPAPEPAASASADDVTFVLTSETSETSPFEAAIRLVSESWVLPRARTNAATTAESFCWASVHAPRRPVSSCGAVVLLAMSLVAAYFLPASVTTSPFVYAVPVAHAPLSAPAPALAVAVKSISLERTTFPVAMIWESPWMFTFAWYSRSRAAWRKPVSPPFSTMSLRTAAPALTEPVQPETPVNVFAVVSRPV